MKKFSLVLLCLLLTSNTYADIKYSRLECTQRYNSDKSRFWEENSLAVYYKEFKLGYLNSSINKVVQKMINKYGEVKVILKNKPKGHNPFEGIDILIQIG